jgi:hypothetical protein
MVNYCEYWTLLLSNLLSLCNNWWLLGTIGVYWSDNRRIVRARVQFPPQAMSLHKEEILLQTVSNISQWFISIFKNVWNKAGGILNTFKFSLEISVRKENGVDLFSRFNKDAEITSEIPKHAPKIYVYYRPYIYVYSAVLSLQGVGYFEGYFLIQIHLNIFVNFFKFQPCKFSLQN